MKKKYKVIFFIFLLVVIAIFITQKLLGVSIFRALGLRVIDNFYIRLTCIGQNKRFMTWGFAAFPVCVSVYPDEGKTCNSSNECLSRLCVRTLNNPDSYCRGMSGDYPLCSNGEATVEQLAEPQEGLFRFHFMFCD